MEPTGINMWGQLALYACLSVAALTWALRSLLGTMTDTYKKVIDAQGTALTAVATTNAGQQAQLNDLRKIIDAKDKECDEKINMVMAEHRKTADAVRKLENGH